MLTLNIPEGMAYQLIYRQVRTVPFVLPDQTDAEFVCLTRVRDIVGQGRLFRGYFGWLGSLKALLKLASGRRGFYALVREGRWVHTAWMAVGFCRHYHVEPADVVIGPIWTDPEGRGRGFATVAMKAAMNAMLARGYHTFFIDTSDDNIACQRAIEKAEFGLPVGAHPRGSDLGGR
jgi:GNAT superfamily N-acetyltransferase